MEKASVKIVGTEDKPIHIYWNVNKRKTDEYLLLLSICSGAYAMEYLDKESFESFCNKFFRYAKKSSNYNEQFKFVLANGNEDCTLFLRNMLIRKWNVMLEYDNDNVAIA